MWFKDDIRNILLGIELSNAHLASHFSDREVEAYRAGFKAAILAAAVSFGIGPTELDGHNLNLDRPPVAVSGKIVRWHR